VDTLLPTLVRLAESIRAAGTGVDVGLFFEGEESVSGALLQDVSFSGDAGRDGLFDFLCRSGDWTSLGEPKDAVDFFLFNTGL
jgi:hypothetical protein